MTLADILDYLDSLPLAQHTDWMHAILTRQQRRVRKALKAMPTTDSDRWDYAEGGRGALGAEREG